jgi:hypothetical protein
MTCTPSYETGDYLLVNDRGEIVAVSGNMDFWDLDGREAKWASNYFNSDDEPYNIAKVIWTKVNEEHDD